MKNIKKKDLKDIKQHNYIIKTVINGIPMNRVIQDET